ncbi:hypothetical protein [Deinococcus sp. QL22]|uniref:hypothetical protein n=1 Tax=Deinococcus sp. QL22 TaxID=2939437 RepID=UPI002017707D|nr:hypothetical protein [Deinococcus sp. QL22]UQN09459.1 hypothetical protein M1R55_23170 [Deinococcus sp. QL22]
MNTLIQILLRRAASRLSVWADGPAPAAPEQDGPTIRLIHPGGQVEVLPVANFLRTARRARGSEPERPHFRARLRRTS